MEVHVKIKPIPAQVPSWRVPQLPLGRSALIWSDSETEYPHPRQNDIIHETHAALPPSLARALRRNHQRCVNPAFEIAARFCTRLPPLTSPESPTENRPQRIPRPQRLATDWQEHNRVYVTPTAVLWSLDQGGSRQVGAAAMDHILWAQRDPNDGMKLHTSDSEFIFPPLCRAEEMVAAVNRVLRYGPRTPSPPSCHQCAQYRRRQTPGNYGECAIQPELTQSCCLLPGFHHRCPQFDPLVPQPR